MESLLKSPMSGIIPPLVTPLKDNDTLDIEGLERLIEHLIAGGVHGLFILGTTGEEQSLSYHLRHEMIRETCRINNGRLPVLVCITDTSIVESIRMAQHGRHAVQVRLAHIFPRSAEARHVVFPAPRRPRRCAAAA